MDKIELAVSKREILGKKVKQLRKEKKTPVHLMGGGEASQALQSDTHALKHVLAQAGETRIINLIIGDEKKPRQVLVKDAQYNPLNDEILHVDFYEVKKGQKLEVEVPLVITGEAPALKTAGTGLMQELEALNVEVLPDNIPNRIEVNVGSLANPGDVLRVKDIKVPDGVAVLNDADLPVVVVTMKAVEKPTAAAEVPPTAAPAGETKAAEK
jgi:large subunit ribosomal protein L25